MKEEEKEYEEEISNNLKWLLKFKFHDINKINFKINSKVFIWRHLHLFRESSIFGSHR